MTLNLPAVLASAPIAVHALRLLAGDDWEADAVDVLQVWPEPACWRYSVAEGWRVERCPSHHGCWDEDGHPFEVVDGWDLEVVDPLVAQIPAPVRAALSAFDGGLGWAVLRLLHDVPEALQHASDNPSLVGLVALQVDRAEQRDTACRELRGLLHEPPEQLLPLVGLPARRRMVHLLDKLDPYAVTMLGLWPVIELLSSSEPEVVDWLEELPEISRDAAVCMLMPALREITTFSLLADESAEDGAHGQLLDLVCARDEGRAPPEPTRFDSWRQAQEVLSGLG